MSRRVGYVHSNDYVKVTNQLPSNRGRAELVHRLIESYDLLPHMDIIEPRMASRSELEQFHDADFVSALFAGRENAEFGLEDDCPPFRLMKLYCSMLVGAALQAARSLTSGLVDVCVHWQGGRHHAHQDEAKGFCYVNDVVLSILELRRKFNRVLCLDIDIHHGDGTEEAFYYSTQVLTVSLHRQFAGFFPGGGSFIAHDYRQTGALNIPLDHGLDDEGLEYVFTRVCDKMLNDFQPEAVVLVCGVDGLSGDPTREWNLTTNGYASCLDYLLKCNIPLLILGGGGYHHANTARCWTELTARILGRKLDNDIPEHDHYSEYGPSFVLDIDASSTQNKNSRIQIDEMLDAL